MLDKENITICSVGDLMLCDSPLYVSVGVGTAFDSIKNKLFNNCKKEFEEADIVIGNLEGVVYQPRSNSLKELQMTCPEEAIEILRDAGFSIVNIANNHCLQHGNNSFHTTEELCKKSGIVTIGTKRALPYLKDVKGVQFAFMSVCLHPEMYQPDDVIYENDIEWVIQQVHKCKDKNRLVVLSVHWGNEYATYPSNKQIKLAHRFIDNGVDILLGHHAHVFQGIELYNGALIAYGQGNFVSDMPREVCRETGIVKISISVVNGRKNISYKVIPHFINDSFIPVVSDGGWISGRQKELALILEGKNTDDLYKVDVMRNQKQGSKEFQENFKKSFSHYRLNILLSMLIEVLKRRIKKKVKVRDFSYGYYDFRNDNLYIKNKFISVFEKKIERM